MRLLPLLDEHQDLATAMNEDENDFVEDLDVEALKPGPSAPSAPQASGKGCSKRFDTFSLFQCLCERSWFGHCIAAVILQKL